MATTAPASARSTARRGIALGEGLGFIAAILIFAWPFGLYTRPPFDDETFALDYIQSYDFHTLLVKFLGEYDNYPPLAYLWFHLLHVLGFSRHALGIASLVLTALAFLLVLDLSLRNLPPSDRGARLQTMFLFLSFPLLYGMGGAVRWYPLVAFFSAGFFWFELRRAKPNIPGGLLLGLAASTNYIAIIPYLAFAVRRYVLMRRFDWRADGRFHLALLCTASLGLFKFAVVTATILGGPGAGWFLDSNDSPRGLGGIAATALGFFGGYRLGLYDGVLALPYMALLAASAWALWRAARQGDGVTPGDDGDLLRVAALLAGFSLLFTYFTAFDHARALLFLAPFLVAVLALGHRHLPLGRKGGLVLMLAAILLFGAALVHGRISTTPYKRNLAIPFDAVTKFVQTNTDGAVLYASSDWASAYLMREAGYCVVDWKGVPPCAAAGLDHFRYIVLARGQNFDVLPELTAIGDATRRSRALITSAHFGEDRTAALKTRLTGVPLDPWLLTIEIYR